MCHGPAGLMIVARCLMRAASGHAAAKANPISTHVVVMACVEMITSIANAQGVLLDWDYRVYIKDEFHKSWRDQVREAYNFFKHGAKDASAIFDRIPPSNLGELNEIQTLLNLNGYYAIGGKRKSPFGEATVLLAIKHSSIAKADFLKDHPEARKQFDQAAKMPHTAIPALRQALFDSSVLPRPGW